MLVVFLHTECHFVERLLPTFYFVEVTRGSCSRSSISWSSCLRAHANGVPARGIHAISCLLVGVLFAELLLEDFFVKLMIAVVLVLECPVVFFLAGSCSWISSPSWSSCSRIVYSWSSNS